MVEEEGMITTAKAWGLALIVACSATIFWMAFFAPVLISDLMLAAGDGINYYVGAFSLPPLLWSDMTFRGLPLAADPAIMTWHPLHWFGKAVLGSFDGFIVSLYVLAAASAGVLGYVMTGSRIAGFVTGFAYAVSGSMVGRLMHPSVILLSASYPLLFAAIEMSRARFRPGWTVVGALGLGLSALALYPYTSFYFAVFSVVYVIVRGSGAADGPVRGMARGVLIGGLGLAVAAIQLLPMVDSASGIARAGANFADFFSISLEPHQLPTTLFPFIFGAREDAWGTPYFGLWNQVEVACYVGILPFLLAVFAILRHRRGDGALLWLGAAVVALIFALGAATPLARLAYEVPVLNWGRGPARIMPLFNLAVAVLAGMGMAHLVRRTLSWRRMMVGLGLGVGVVGGTALLLWGLSPLYDALAQARRGVEGYTLSPLENPAMQVPLGLLVLGVLAIVLVRATRRTRLACTVLVGVMLVDLSSFGWFMQWRLEAPSRTVFTEPDNLERLRRIVGKDGPRLLTVGSRGRETPVLASGNRSLIWGLPNARGFSSWARAMPAGLSQTDIHPDNPAHAIHAIRYILVPTPPADQTRRWRGDDLSIGDMGRPATAYLDAMLVIDGVGLPRQVRFADPGASGSRLALVVRSGRDAGFAGTLTATLTDRRGDNLALTEPVDLAADDEALLVLPFAPSEDQSRIVAIRIEAVPARPDSDRSGRLLMRALAIDDPDNKRLTPVRLDHFMLAPESGWRVMQESAVHRMFERRAVTPRAWLVDEALVLDPDEKPMVLRLGQRPDGAPFDPAQTVILDEPVALDGAAAADIANSAVRITESGGSRLRLTVEAPRPSVLVVADAWDRHWRATLNGESAPILKANGDSRAVVVPAGRHEIDMSYRPGPFFVGFGVTVVALATCMGLVALSARRAGSGRARATMTGLSLGVAVVGLFALVAMRSPAAWAPDPLPSDVMRAALREDMATLAIMSDAADEATVPYVFTGPLAWLMAPPAALTPLNAAILTGQIHAVVHLLERGAPASEIDLCLAREIDYGRLEALIAERLGVRDTLPVLCEVPDGLARVLRWARAGLIPFRPLGPDEDRPLSVRTREGSPVGHLAAGNGRLIEAHTAAGWDPNTLETMAIDGWDSPVAVAPILVPVLLDDVSFVEMLLDGGVDLDRPGTALAMCEARRRGLTGAEAVFERALNGRPWPDCSRHQAPWVEPLRQDLLGIREEYS